MSRRETLRNRIRKHTRRRHHDQPGVAPGTLESPEGASVSIITVIAYSEEEFIEEKVASVSDLPAYLKKWPVIWINIDGLGSIDVISALGQMFGLHPLALEDVSNTHHRAKIEDYESYLFIVTHMVRILKETLDTEQLSMFVGKNYVLTLQERNDGDVLDPVRERLRRGKGRMIRKVGADYLAYSLLDATVDGYFPVLEYLGDTINDLEDRVIDKPDRPVIAETHRIKRDLRTLRQAMWPLREAISNLTGDHDIITDNTRIYLRDCHDHIISVLDLLEIDRERASGLIDIYLSSINNQMNETMKVLTIISTIFIPLSFIASIYGMNFDTEISPYNMPELEWVYGYPFALGLMALIASLLLALFIRRGWIRFQNAPNFLKH